MEIIWLGISNTEILYSIDLIWKNLATEKMNDMSNQVTIYGRLL